MNKKILIIVAIVVVTGASLVLLMGGDKKNDTEYSIPSVPLSKTKESDKTPISNSSDCEVACANYTNKCLTLVPNADQNLFNEGLLSCMNECAKWNGLKTECMINSIDCESMTTTCGL